MEGTHKTRSPEMRLSPQQTRIMSMVSNGKLSKEIASELGIMEPTVKNHLATIYLKLGARNRVEATNIFIRNNRGTFCPIKEGLFCQEGYCIGCTLFQTKMGLQMIKRGR